MTGVPHQGHRVNHEGTTSMPKKHEQKHQRLCQRRPLIIRFSWGLINFNNNSNNNNYYFTTTSVATTTTTTTSAATTTTATTTTTITVTTTTT